MKTINLIKSKIVVSIGIVILIALLIIRSCSSNVQDNQNLISEVAQSQINQQQTYINELNNEIKTRQNVIMGLYALIVSKDSILHLKDKKIAQIAGNLAIELKKNQGLTDDESVNQFLANAGNYNNVLKYDSGYVIPIAPIRYYVDIQSSFDMQKDVNQVLIGKIKDQNDKYIYLETIVKEKDKDISDLNTKVLITDQIVTEKDKQIKAENRRFKMQRVKTYVVGGIGVVLVTLSLIR